MRWFRVMCLWALVGAGWVQASDETAVLHPLAVTPSASLTEPPEALQKRFLAVARDRSGFVLLLRKEAEAALQQAGARDYARSDDALARLAKTAKTQHALFVALQLTPKGELELTGRVVKDSGERERSARVTVPRGAGSLLDALGTAAAAFFEALRAGQPAEVPPPVVEAPPPPPRVEPEPVAAPAAAVVANAAPPPASPLRTVGFVAAGVGAAAAVAGAVLFATAGTVDRDLAGNIAIADAPRVAGIQLQQRVGVGAIAGGSAVAIAGVVMALLAPAAPVTAVVAPRADGLSLVVEGRF